MCRVNDAAKLKELIATARFARCRSRFVMPVILYENKVSIEYNVIYTIRCVHVLVELHTHESSVHTLTYTGASYIVYTI